MDEQLSSSCELRTLSAWPVFFAPINARHVTLETSAEMHVKNFRYFGPVLTAFEILSDFFFDSPMGNAVTFSLG
jgi:hypothetical protein